MVDCTPFIASPSGPLFSWIVRFKLVNAPNGCVSLFATGTEPYQHLVGLRVDLIHQLDLTIAFAERLLVDAYSINPKNPTVRGITKVDQSIVAILRDAQHIGSAANIRTWFRWAPCVRECLVSVAGDGC